MNLVKALNKNELRFTEAMYQEYCRAYEEMTNYVFNAITEAYINCKVQRDKTYDENYNLLYDYFEKLLDASGDYVLSLSKTINLRSYFNKYVTSNCSIYITTKKEHDIFKKRGAIIIQRVCNQFSYFIEDLSDYFQKELLYYLNTLEEELDIIKSNEESNPSKEQPPKEENSERLKKEKGKKIYEYKEMEKLAIEYGYFYKWTNGSHSIFENSKSKRIVVIPKHSLGLGLSCKIQKQILKNAI